jgi:hypothetical protein
MNPHQHYHKLPTEYRYIVHTVIDIINRTADIDTAIAQNDELLLADQIAAYMLGHKLPEIEREAFKEKLVGSLDFAKEYRRTWINHTGEKK